MHLLHTETTVGSNPISSTKNGDIMNNIELDLDKAHTIEHLIALVKLAFYSMGATKRLEVEESLIEKYPDLKELIKD
jgi:hypothetical protein